VIKGDENIPVIALASIVAKVSRDAEMEKLAKEFPEYGWEKNKGYGTQVHMNAITQLGLTHLHRKSFLKNHV
jgi:ribonuclease HII